jgi:hypothetical protein
LVNNVISITVSQISNLASTLAGYLQLAGGTMSGAIAMGANKITGLANGSAAQDAAAFGQIPVPANGYGITGNTGATPTPAVGLTSLAGSLGSSVYIPNSATTLLTTGSLSVGTWLVNAVINLWKETTSSAVTVNFNLAVGTATATLAGATSQDIGDNTSAAYNYTSVHLSAIVTVSVAGTLIVQGTANAGTNDWLALGGGTGFTGYTAVRVA